jgi:hypothetical protein
MYLRLLALTEEIITLYFLEMSLVFKLHRWILRKHMKLTDLHILYVQYMFVLKQHSALEKNVQIRLSVEFSTIIALIIS